MADNDEVMFMLGQIKGQLEGMNKRLDKVDTMDSRLRKVEQRAAINGAVTGGLMGVGVSVIAHAIREALKVQGT